MFNTSYNYLLKGKQKGESGTTVHLFVFCTPRKRRIVVEVHEHPQQQVAIVKFFDKAHRFSARRFSLLSASGEAAPIIRTTIQIMLDFYHQNPYTSFAFMGAPDANGDLNDNKRFRIYCGVMKRLFSNLEFEHLQRPDRSLYILLNRNYHNAHPKAAVEIIRLLEAVYPDEWGH